jgi:hypothetical protein
MDIETHAREIFSILKINMPKTGAFFDGGLFYLFVVAIPANTK